MIRVQSTSNLHLWWPKCRCHRPRNFANLLEFIYRSIEAYSIRSTVISLPPAFQFEGEESNMASSMMVSSATVTVARSTAPAAQSTMVAPYTGLKSAAGALPTARRTATNLNHLPSNGGRAQCMKVWPIEGKKKFETLSYLPPLTPEALLKQIDYLLRSGWVPCLEFCKVGFVYRENHRSPGYYDGRYWTMWKLPMFGCSDAVQVVKEVEECKKEYSDAFIRIIGFDNVRQVQCISFIVYKPTGKEY